MRIKTTYQFYHVTKYDIFLGNSLQKIIVSIRYIITKIFASKYSSYKI